MRVAVIGGTGNIGFATVRRLADDGHHVVAAARRLPSPADTPDHAEWMRLDVTAPSAREDLEGLLRGVDACIYSAWALQPMRRTDHQTRVGVTGLSRTIEACLTAGVRHLIALSSSGAYAPRHDRLPVDESHPITERPVSAYSAQKAAMEAVLAAASADPDVGDRLTISWLRPSLVGQRAAAGELRRVGVSPLLPRGALGRLPFMPLARGGFLQVVHADDVAGAVAPLVLTRTPGPFNLGAPDVLGPTELAAPLARRPLELPNATLLLAANAAWSARVWPLDPGWLRMASVVPVLGTARARKELGWDAVHSGVDTWAELVEGMRDGDGGPTPILRPRTLRDDVTRLVSQGLLTRRALT